MRPCLKKRRKKNSAVILLYDLTYLYGPPGHIPKGLHVIDNSRIYVYHISSNRSKEKQAARLCVSTQWVVTMSVEQDFTKLGRDDRNRREAALGRRVQAAGLREEKGHHWTAGRCCNETCSLC